LGASRQASGCPSAWTRILPHASQAAAVAARSSTQTIRHNAVRAEVFVRSDMTPTPFGTFYRIAAPHETDFAAGTCMFNVN
jgi:hypothetical protein